MPFPLDESFIVRAEKALGAALPAPYREMMIEENGGRIALGNEQWWLHPVLDTSDRKRLKRTCNHVLHETETRAGYGGFPEGALEIAKNGAGDALVLLKEDGKWSDTVYHFRHETRSVRKSKWTISDLWDKRESS